MDGTSPGRSPGSRHEPGLWHGSRLRRTARASACLFALQLLLAALGSVLPAADVAANRLLVPICADGHLVFVDPGTPPGEQDDRSQPDAHDCAKCCPQPPAALLSLPAPQTLPRQGRAIEHVVLPRQAVRAGRSTAPPPPSRAPPLLAS